MDTPTSLAIEQVPLEALHLDPANARAHGEQNMEAIVASLQRFGQAEPLVVHRPTGRVIGGNGRLMAMKRLGWTECAVVQLDIDETQATALAIALNRTGELAEWDNEVLARLLQQLQQDEALEGVGFSDEDIDALLAELEADVETAEVEDPGPGEIPDDPVSQRGDLWLLGDHRLLCGDSTSPEDMARLMAGEKAQLLATDPPYLVDYDGTNHPADHHKKAGRKSPKTAGSEVGNKHWDEYIDPEASVTFFTAWLKAALGHCVERVPVYQWHASKRAALVEEAWEQNGLFVHQQVIWTKTRGVLTRSHYLWQHEPCFYGWRVGKMAPKYRRPDTSATTVWEISQQGEQDGIHPTQKPTAIFERPISYHTRSGEVVLEPFSGSGSQLIAAERLRRRCFAMELSPGFVDVAVRRWQEATGKDAVLDGNGETFAAVSASRKASDGEEAG